MAQLVRFGLNLLGLGLPAALLYILLGGWALAVSILVLLGTGIAADAAFRKLASAETVRSDLERRVRNPAT